MNEKTLKSAPPNFENTFGRFSGLISNHDVSIYEKNFIHRRLYRKAWVFGGAFSPDGFVGLAIVDAGYAASAFCYYFDPKTSTLIEEKTLKAFYFPNTFQARIDQNWFLKSGKREWSLKFEDRMWHFSFKGKRLNLSMQMKHSFEGISALAPHRPFHYTYKLASLPSCIEVSVDGLLAKKWSGSYGTFDFSLGFPNRKIFWNWGAFSGKTQDGVSVGINIVHPFNDGLENALWFDGRLIPLSQVQFHYKSFGETWHIKTVDGTLSLDFHPNFEHKKNSNALVFKTHFKQGIGPFKGVWTYKNTEYVLEGSGVVEEHSALW